MTRLMVLALGIALSGCRITPAPPVSAAAAGSAATPDAVSSGYDLIYAMTYAKVSWTPSTILQDAIAGRPPGTALDIGSGEGRNALFLARAGYAVTAVDLSKIGLDLTREQAEAEHLTIATVARDINAFPIGQKRWDLITLIDFPFPYRALLPRIAAGLKSGGLIVIEDISVADSITAAPGADFTYTYMDRHDLDRPFRGYRILRDEQGQRSTIWGVSAPMIEFVAEKPR